MSSPTFGLPTSGNNAPLPIPGNTNPTGNNYGVGFGGASFPNYPMFGPTNNGVVSPSSNAPIFGTGSMDTLTTGAPTSTSFGSMLNSTYGSGFAAYLDNIFQNGLFNPQVAASFLNAMQPGNMQGLSSVQDSFGAEGSRFGSAAALGIGNYESQVNLNEQQTLASLYEQAQQEQIGLLENVLPSVQQEKANQGGWVDDLVGGLEVGGAIAGTILTGGLASPALLPLAMAGITGLTTLNRGLTGGGGGGGGGYSPSLANPNLLGYGNTGTFGSGAPSYTGMNADQAANYIQTYGPDIMDASAGSDLGGSTNWDNSVYNGGLLL